MAHISYSSLFFSLFFCLFSSLLFSFPTFSPSPAPLCRPRARGPAPVARRCSAPPAARSSPLTLRSPVVAAPLRRSHAHSPALTTRLLLPHRHPHAPPPPHPLTDELPTMPSYRLVHSNSTTHSVRRGPAPRPPWPVVAFLADLRTSWRPPNALVLPAGTTSSLPHPLLLGPSSSTSYNQSRCRQRQRRGRRHRRRPRHPCARARPPPPLLCHRWPSWRLLVAVPAPVRSERRPLLRLPALAACRTTLYAKEKRRKKREEKREEKRIQTHIFIHPTYMWAQIAN